MQLLEVKNLNISFQGNHVVKNVSFSLNKRETLGIVGESGSGKTVTALSIMRLLSQDASIDGIINFSPTQKSPINLCEISADEMRHFRGNDIAMIFQEPMTSLNPVLSCGYQVAESLIAHKNLSKKEAREQTVTWFEKVNLPRSDVMFDSFPHQLSGGQKQRVMIAMAMCCNPSLLIADEPTTALDVTVQSAILSLMRTLQKENNMGMLFITHDLGVVAEIADRILVMYKGKIVEENSVTNIFSNPQHPYTKGLLACRPPLNKRLRKLPTVRDFIKEENGEIVEIKTSDFSSQNEILPEETQAKRRVIYSNTPVLKVEKIKVHFPISKRIFGRTTEYVLAVDDISFDVYPGETLGIVGESGSGKTTLGRTILRLIEPTSGKIIFKGKDFSSIHGKELREMRKFIQMIFQDPYSSLNPRMTIGNAIIEPLKVHNLYRNKRKERVYELMEMVKLNSEYFDRYPHEISSGQRQRVCIARALSVEPEFLICDESVSSLDVSIQAQVLNLINDLKRSLNFTCIFISHDVSVVKFMSDRIVVMKEGRIEEIGDSDQLFSSPSSAYTQKLFNAIPAQSSLLFTP